MSKLISLSMWNKLCSKIQTFLFHIGSFKNVMAQLLINIQKASSINWSTAWRNSVAEHLYDHGCAKLFAYGHFHFTGSFFAISHKKRRVFKLQDVFHFGWSICIGGPQIEHLCIFRPWKSISTVASTYLITSSKGPKPFFWWLYTPQWTLEQAPSFIIYSLF